MYKLKDTQTPFTCVDGPEAGKSYRHDKVYAVVPQVDADKFTKVAKKTTKKKEVKDA